MADGRRNNGGHSTKGKAGRPKKADEDKMITLMDSVMQPKVAWEKLAWAVKFGDVQAINTWLAYRYGKPKASMDVTSDGEQLKSCPIVAYNPEGEKPESL